MTIEPEPNASDAKPEGSLPGLLSKAKHELERFAVMTAYLWAMFLLFKVHTIVVLAQHNISYTSAGLDLVKALVLAKVMLVADSLRMGVRFRRGPLIVPILGRSVLFAILFFVVDILEKVLEGAFHHQSVAESLPTYGGGLVGAMLSGIIVSFALGPFFAFEEIDVRLGEGKLGAMLFGLEETPRRE